MNHAIDRSDVPIRLFKSDALEFFTHISPVTVVVIWLPVALVFFALGALSAPGWVQLAGFVVGLFLWTLAEYTLHRFVFHFHPMNPTQERIIFLFHGVHHTQPQCKTRLVMPPVVSIPMALLFYGLFYLILDVLLGQPLWIAPFMAGFIIGYLVYDLTHYATHHFPMRWGFLKFLRRYHLQHHYKTPEQRFGVSSPLWDWVFGTMPADR